MLRRFQFDQHIVKFKNMNTFKIDFFLSIYLYNHRIFNTLL